MPVPLYQAKADLFRTLGHPVRIRVLELLQDGPKAVRELLLDIDIEASSLSQPTRDTAPRWVRWNPCCPRPWPTA